MLSAVRQGAVAQGFSLGEHGQRTARGGRGGGSDRITTRLAVLDHQEPVAAEARGCGRAAAAAGRGAPEAVQPAFARSRPRCR